MKPTILHVSCGDLPAALVAQREKAARDLWHTRYIRSFTSHGELFTTRLITGELHIGRERLIFPEHPLVQTDPVSIPHDPKKWGPPMWDGFHAATRALETPAEREAYLVQFNARVPCGECKEHWGVLCAEYPPPFDTAEAFEAWGKAMHNRVNVALGKPEWHG